MTDRELLEAAARAAGIEYGVIHDTPRRKCVDGWTPWNPLSDDGDVFALMVALRLDVKFLKPNGVSVSLGPYVSFIDNDPREATRRAIMRAAAEIGRDA